MKTLWAGIELKKDNMRKIENIPTRQILLIIIRLFLSSFRAKLEINSFKHPPILVPPDHPEKCSVIFAMAASIVFSLLRELKD